MELGLLRKDDEGLMHAILKSRKLDDEGKNVENTNNKALLDTIAYKLEFTNRTT